MAADYAYAFARCTITGDCFGGTERWSTGFQVGFEESAVASIDPGAAGALAAAWEVFFENSVHHIPDEYRTLETKVALINTNGTTNLDEISWHTLSPIVVGGSPDNPMPAQITVAATMTSQLQRGIGSKGRMFLPGYAHTVEAATGKIPTARTAELATGMKLFFDTINDNVLLPGIVIIASKGHKTAALDENGQPVYVDGINRTVTGVRVGNVYDTQRRRRNELTEQYSTAVLDIA
jgi:hypothetical protein